MRSTFLRRQRHPTRGLFFPISGEKPNLRSKSPATDVPPIDLNRGCQNASARMHNRTGSLPLDSRDSTGWVTETAHDAGLLDKTGDGR